MTSSLPPLVQACSGALASASANAITYPLDLVATKVQTTNNPRLRDICGALDVLKYIVRTQGLSGLYDGIATDTAWTILSNFLYFYFYTVLHALAARRKAQGSQPRLTSLKRALMSSTAPVLLGVPAELVVGFVAGVASRAVATPLNVLTVRLQSQSGDEAEERQADVLGDHVEKEKEGTSAKTGREEFVALVKSIYADQGLQGFWAGFAPAVPLALTPALTLLFYQLLRRIRIRLPLLSSSSSSPYARPARASVAVRAFLNGACANAAALALLYPLVLAKVRVQAWRRRGARESDAVGGAGNPTAAAPTIMDVWRAAHAERGVAGLYAGLGVQLAKGFVSQGVTMTVKQRIEQAVVRLYLRT